MDAVSASAQSAEVLSQILQMANAKSINMAKKLMELSVRTAVGAEFGKGGNFDAVG